MRGASEGPEALVATFRDRGITDERLLQAVLDVPRAAFVPPEHVDHAYQDRPIPISHGQVTTQPSLSAAMIDALELVGDEKVLEIGTGYGFQTALLAKLARFVWSVERWADLAQQARENLARQGIDNIEIVGDGTEGLPDQAPYHVVLVSAAFPEVPSPLSEQLRDGGRLVQPIGPGGADDVTLFEKRGDDLIARRTVIPAHFVQLYGRYGFPPDREEES